MYSCLYDTYIEFENNNEILDVWHRELLSGLFLTKGITQMKIQCFTSIYSTHCEQVAIAQLGERKTEEYLGHLEAPCSIHGCDSFCEDR